MISGIEFNRPDLLNELNRKATVSGKVISIHQLVRQRYDFIHRIGVAVYDPECDELKAFVHSTDTGTGIPKKIRDRIFDPFFTTKGVGKGSGQGLAIAYSAVVDKHQGRINLESTEGQGSVFTIRLPLALDAGG